MYLESIQTINYTASGFFQLSRVFNITFLIKSCPKFYKYHNFFSIFCRFNQCIHDLTADSQTIQCHFNGYDRIISCCLIKQIGERFDIFKRIR